MGVAQVQPQVDLDLVMTTITLVSVLMDTLVIDVKQVSMLS